MCIRDSSISNQKKILKKYAMDRGYTNIQFYIDDGISGTTFNRAGFQSVIADVESGKVKRVIVKDMSLSLIHISGTSTKKV